MRRYLNLFIITSVLASLLVAALFPPMTASASSLLAPTISATKTDAIIGDDGDNKADPGETIEYTVAINNSGSDATGVTFDDILDLNTTLVGGSVNISPLALDDTYDTIGNTLLDVGVGASDPAVHVAGGSLFANDMEFLGDTYTLKSVEAVSGAAPITSATEAGGSVTVQANGSFTYTPPLGFSGADHFDYLLTDDGPDNILGNADDLTGAGRVTINVNTQRVWYVKNNATAGGLGRSTDPLDTLAEAQAASSANDTIYVFQGDGTTTGQNAGITLKNGQRLLGEGVALTVPIASGSFNGVPSPTTIALRAEGARPTIGNSAGDGVSLNTVSIGASFSAVEIRGLNISGTGAGSNAVDVTTNSTFGGSFELADNVISAAGAEGIDVNGAGSGTLTVNMHDNTVTATGNGIDILRASGAGSVNVIAFDDNAVTGATGGIGINIVGGGVGTVLFDTDPNTASYAGNTVSGGNTVIGSSGAGNGAGTSGMVLNNIKGDLNFTDLDIYTDNGAALSITGTTSNFLTSGTGARVTATTGTPTLVAVNGPALTTNQTNINIVPTTFSSTNSGTTGVSLLETSGTLTAPSGSSITNATGTDFSVDGNLVATATVSVTYAGTITDDLGALVQIADVTGGSPTYAFTGAITDNNDGDGSGISLMNNDSATIRFSGGLLLSTGSSPAFTATNGATAVEVCDENPCNPAATGALVNTLTSTTATALNVSNTTIGSNNLEFKSISSTGGSATGIILDTTGSSGGLKVVGDGSNTSVGGNSTGGTISNKAGSDGSTINGIGIYLNNTANVVLRRMTINGTNQNYAIKGLQVNGFVLEYSTIGGTNGTAASLASPENYGEGAVFFGNSTTNGVLGTVTFTNNNITGGRARDLSIVNTTAGTTTLTVKGNTIGGMQNFSDGNQCFAVEARVSSGVVINTTFGGTNPGEGNTINNCVSDNANFTGQDNTTMDVVFRNNTLSNNNPNNIISGGNLVLATKGTMTFHVTGNTMRDANGSAVTLFKADSSISSSETLSGFFDSNTIGVSGVANSGSASGNGIYVSAGGTGTMNFTITNNQIHQIKGNAHIYADNTGGSYTANFKIEGNLFDTPGSGLFTGVAITNGSPSLADTVNVCAEIGGSTAAEKNTFNLPTIPNDVYIYVAGASSGHTFNLPGLTIPATLASIQTFINNNNTGLSDSFADVQPNAALSHYTGIGTSCSTPIAMIPDDNYVFAQVQPETNSTIQAQNNSHSANILAVAAHSAKQAEQVMGIVPKTGIVTSSVNLGTGKPLFRSVQPAPAQSGETVGPISIGTLPGGKSVTIKFQVTVNTPISASRIVNQGTVTYTGGPVGGVNTSDPSPNADSACTGTGTQTCTPTDRPDTTVTSINRQTPSGANTNATSVTWRVTFNDPISGLTSSNFALLSGGSLSGTSITSVTAMSGVPATQWDVLVNTGSGDGLLELNMIGDAGLAYDVLNGNTDTPFTTGQDYTIDKTAPMVTSFTRNTPSVQFTNADTLVFEVTFSEPITGFGTADFIVHNNTPLATTSATVTSVSSGPFRVTISGGDLATDLFNGDVGLDFSPTMNITDQAGNALANAEPATDQTYTVDNAAPSVTLSSGTSDPTNANPISVTAQFSETVSGFLATDILAGNATVDNFIAVDGDTYTFDLTPSGQGLVTVDIAAGVATDAVEHGNTAAAQFSRTFDSSGPTVSMSSAAPDPTNTSPIPVTVQFSEIVTGFTAGEITVGNATVTNFNAVDGDTYTFNLTPSGQGLVTADIAAGVTQDGGGNGNTAATQFSRTFDSVAPTILSFTRFDPVTSPTSADSLVFNVLFSEKVFDIGTNDFVVNGTTTATIFSVGIINTNGLYQITVEGGDLAAFNGTIGLDFSNTASMTDAVGNVFVRVEPSTDETYTLDNSIPTVTMSSAAPDPTNSSLISVTAQFSENVTGFDVADITVGSATIDNFIAVDGDTYTFDLTPLVNGLVTADIAAGVAQDAIGNGNSAATQFSRLFDSIAPTVTINQEALQADPASASPINFAVIFSEPVTGFATGDVTLSTSTATGTLVGTVTETAPKNGTTYNVAVSGMTSDGTVVASLLAGVATDGANFNNASTSTDNSVLYVANPTEHVISGNVGVGGVVLSYVDGAVKTVTSQANGSYSFSVSFNWSGTVTPTNGCYTFNPPSLSYTNVVTDQMAQNYIETVDSAAGCVDLDISVAGTSQGQFVLPPQESMVTSFTGVNSGLVKMESTNTVPLLGAEQVTYNVYGTNISYTEMMGMPDSQLDNVYWLPWYNNVDLDTQLRFGNVSNSTAVVHVYIAGSEMSNSPFTLLPGQSTRVSFDGINNGPVRIESNVNIVAAERVLYKVNGKLTSFSEMMALPDSQLNTTYWLPWYNNVDLDTQLRIANVTNNPATVQVTIGGVAMAPINLPAGQSTRVSYIGVNNGTVKIESNQNIIVAERVIYKINNVNTSFSDMMAFPASQLDTVYWLPWYNNSGNLDTQLRVGNVSNSTATVHVYIGGVETSNSPFTLQPGESTRVSFAGVNNGPLKVESDQNIVVTKRLIYKVNGIPTSFSEMMGLPDSLLSTIYWLPWYNNVDLDTRLRFVVP